MLLNKILPSLLFGVTSLAMSTTRYTVPIAESTKVLNTRDQLNDMALQYPLGTLDDRGGGYYLLDHDATILAVASDPLCDELDEAFKQYQANKQADGNSEETENAPQSANDIETHSALTSRVCSHPPCHNHNMCRRHAGCHTCFSGFKKCV